MAQEVAREFVADDHVLAAFLVGSEAFKMSTRDSDVDLAIIVKNKSRPFTGNFRHHGETVGLEFFAASDLEMIPQDSSLGQIRLREFGRLSNGLCLWTRWPAQEKVLRILKTAFLNPAISHEMLTVARSHLRAATNAGSDLKASFWHLQKSVMVLAILHLQHSPIRFHKVKWLYSHLGLIGDKVCQYLLRRAFSLRHDSPRADFDHRLATVSDSRSEFHRHRGWKQEYVENALKAAIGLSKSRLYYDARIVISWVPHLIDDKSLVMYSRISDHAFCALAKSVAEYGAALQEQCGALGHLSREANG